MASNKFGDRAVERLIVTIVWWACHVATSASLLRYCVSTSAKIEDQKVQKQIFMKTKVAWTRRLHPQKNPNVLFERCEQPIDVKPGLKIRANSSVWLDFRGEKSPQKPPLTFKRGGQLSSPPSTDWLAPGVNFTEKIPSTLNLRLLELLPVAAS